MRQWPILGTRLARSDGENGRKISVGISCFHVRFYLHGNPKHEAGLQTDYKIPSHHSVSNNLTFEFSRLVFESV
jgi:hypothetical protein